MSFASTTSALVQRIRRFLAQLEPYLEGLDEEAKDQVSQSATTLGWLYYARNISAIPWDFVKDLEGTSFYWRRATDKILGRESPETREDKEKVEHTNSLMALGYRETAPLEKMLIEALERGYSNKEEFDEVLSDINEKIKISKARREFDKAWDIFRSPFHGNEQEFVDALLKCFDKQGAYFEDPRALENAVAVFENLGRFDEARALEDIYFERRRTFDPSYQSRSDTSYQFRSLKAPKTARVRARVDKIIEGSTQSKDVAQILESMDSGTVLSREDINALQAYDEENWFRFFIQHKHGDLRLDIYRVLKLGERVAPAYESIIENATRALRKIGRTSKINAVRVSGIDFREG